ncbi:SpoIIE family protein phosphatase [bacterium]|nr:SpoIIE family protein phosphatase [bacterium]
MKKEKSQIRKYLIITVIIVIITAVAAIMAQALSLPLSANEIFLFQISLVMLVFSGMGRSWFPNFSIIKRILLLGAGIIILWILINITTPSFLFEDNSNAELDAHISALYISFILISFIICGFILKTLRGMVFIQQSKHTLRNFNIMLFVIGLRIAVRFSSGYGHLSSIAGGSDFADSMDFFNSSMFGANDIFIALIVSMAIINGFRVKWIHYLNKKEKLITLVLFLIVGSISGRLSYSAQNVIDYSVVAGIFIHSAALVLLIYSSMSIMGILFLLPSAGIMDRRIRELRSFQELSAAVSSVFEKDKLGITAVKLAAQITGADSTWIELYDGEKFSVLSSYGVNEDKIKLIEKSMEAIRSELFQNSTTLLVNVCSRNRLTNKFPGYWKKRAGSLIAARLAHKDKNIGVIYGIKSGHYGFMEESRSLFEAFAFQVALAVENANLIQITIDQQIYKEELRVAHEAQMRLLPHSKPLTDTADIDGFCITANEIGGDLYDFIEVNDDRIDILVGDVSGKGASAAFYMAELKGVLLALSQHLASPSEILLQANGFVKNYFERAMFATMAYCVFIPSKRVIRFARAGHPPVILVRNSKAEMVQSAGLGLGLTCGDAFKKTLEEREIKLKENDVVFIYTDGITEARNSRGEEFGEKALVDLVKEASESASDDALKMIRERLNEFTSGVQRHDDLTAVILKVIS